MKSLKRSKMTTGELKKVKSQVKNLLRTKKRRKLSLKKPRLKIWRKKTFCWKEAISSKMLD